MSTNTTAPPCAPADEAPDPNHDAQAAAIYRAIALRFYARYIDMRQYAEFRGGDLQEHGALCGAGEAAKQYQCAVEDFLWETTDTAGEALALVEFAGVIAADRLNSEVLRDSGPVSDERDAFHQTVALAAAAEWINTVCLKEWFKARKAAYGPSAMPPAGGAA